MAAEAGFPVTLGAPTLWAGTPHGVGDSKTSGQQALEVPTDHHQHVGQRQVEHVDLQERFAASCLSSGRYPRRTLTSRGWSLSSMPCSSFRIGLVFLCGAAARSLSLCSALAMPRSISACLLPSASTCVAAGPSDVDFFLVGAQPSGYLQRRLPVRTCSHLPGFTGHH